MKVLLHDGNEIREFEAGDMLPDIFRLRNGDFVRSDRKADGMVVYYRENMNKEGNGPEEIHS